LGLAVSKTGEIDAATEFILYKVVKNAKSCWDEECTRAMQEKFAARRKCIIREASTNLDIYQQKNEI